MSCNTITNFCLSCNHGDAFGKGILIENFLKQKKVMIDIKQKL